MFSLFGHLDVGFKAEFHIYSFSSLPNFARGVQFHMDVFKYTIKKNNDINIKILLKLFLFAMKF